MGGWSERAGAVPLPFESDPSGSDALQRGLRTTAKLAVLLFVLGTFTWRTRTASSLTSNPLDAAASVRVGLDLLALTVAGAGLLHELAQPQPQPLKHGLRLPLGVTLLYGGYIVIVTVGVLTAVDPRLVSFRAFDLFVALFVAAQAARWLTITEIVGLIRSLLTFMASLILFSSVVWPGGGLVEARGGVFPFRLVGVFPEFSANSVGAIGLLMFALSLTTDRYRRVGVAAGLAMIVLSQYRTGYAAAAVVIVVYLIASPGATRRIGALLALPLGWLIFQTATFQEAWIRGESASNSVENLSGRTDWWAVAFQVAERSPWIGTGLSSGTRLEVLAGTLGNTEASTIHGTWVEVYVGTGWAGLLFLSTFVIAAASAAWKVRDRTLAPLLVLAAVMVRSLTGSSIELASTILIFTLMLTIASSRVVQDREPRSRPPKERHPLTQHGSACASQPQADGW